MNKKEIKFLFWNINKNKSKILNSLVELILLNRFDIVILAEYGNLNKIQLLEALNKEKVRYNYHYNDYETEEKFIILSKFNRECFTILQNKTVSRRFVLYKVSLPFYDEFLLAVVHLPNKRNTSKDSQGYITQELSEEIGRKEKILGHQRTLVIGDFNLNPFEIGMISARGIHATMDKSIALSRSRVVDILVYDFFYNPMWSFLGDSSRGQVAGTYYYRSAEYVNYGWNIFDQVLIRPDLIDSFNDDSLDIVTKIKNVSLLSKNNLIDRQYSDHLPIEFSFNFKLTI